MRITVSSHSAREPPSCACPAPPTYPAPLIVSADMAICAACTTGSRRTRRPRLRRPPLVKYKLGQNRRATKFRAARRARVARVVATPQRAPARCCCCYRSGRRCRCRCGRRGAASPCRLVELGGLGARAAAGGRPRPRWPAWTAASRPPAETTNREPSRERCASVLSA